MRENGLPQVLTWRWTPCVAFVLGAVSFAAFMLLAIPDHIGEIPAEATSDSLRLQLARTQAAPTPESDWSSDTTNTASATPRLAERTAAMRGGDVSTFPKRGFSPPLERPEPPPAPAPAAPPPTPQPQLNIPAPAPAPPPAEQPPASPPAQPEVMPQAQAVPPPPDAQAAQPPAPAPN
jgi:hypothetical protein